MFKRAGIKCRFKPLKLLVQNNCRFSYRHFSFLKYKNIYPQTYCSSLTVKQRYFTPKEAETYQYTRLYVVVLSYRQMLFFLKSIYKQKIYTQTTSLAVYLGKGLNSITQSVTKMAHRKGNTGVFQAFLSATSLYLCKPYLFLTTVSLTLFL